MRAMKKTQAFVAAFWQGLAASALVSSTATSPVIKSPAMNRSDRDAMRGDWERVGADLRRVIAREETTIY